MAKLTLLFKGKILKVYLATVGDEVVVGRDPDCTIAIDSLAVSPRHLTIQVTDQGDTLRDEDSEAGVFVNGNKVTSHTLQDGDQIQVGKHTLSYSAEVISPESIQLTEMPESGPQDGANQIGWLQVLNGSSLGRTLALKQAITRIGKSGAQSASIARRQQGYFLSTLEGEPPCVGGQSIGEHPRLLADGDIIRIGKSELQFYMAAE